MTQKTFDGLTARFVASVAMCLPKNLTGVQMEEYINNPKKLQAALAAGFKLSAVALVTFSVSAYWQSNAEKKLWVSDEFRQRITSAYVEPVVHRGLAGVTSFDLKSNTFDTKIIAEMGGEAEVRKRAFTPDQIAELRDKQLSGEAGQLLTNGVWNLFHVVGVGGALFVVSLRWDSGVRSWWADAWNLGEGGGWHAGGRVFRNTLSFQA